jgi:hypothetical protein
MTAAGNARGHHVTLSRLELLITGKTGHQIPDGLRLRTDAVDCRAQIEVERPAFYIFILLVAEPKKNRSLTKTFIFLFLRKWP